MNYLSWWYSGLLLSGVILLHWLVTGRMMAVSGRFTALVDRLRHGPAELPPEMDQEALLAAIQLATNDEFGQPGEGEINIPLDKSPSEEQALLASGPRPLSQHFLFFAAVFAGGALSSVLAGTWSPTLGLNSDGFSQLTGDNGWISSLLLVSGGIFVGFGTRMSGGCTSGHGLCGTSRFQSGSLLATSAFFGAGIVTAFLLDAL